MITKSIMVLQEENPEPNPADIVLMAVNPVICDGCEEPVKSYVTTYLQGGPPASQNDPDNVWVTECLSCFFAGDFIAITTEF